MSEPVRIRDKASWRDTLLNVLKAWNRQQVWKILTAIGPLREGDELILLSQTLPDLSRLKPRDAA